MLKAVALACRTRGFALLEAIVAIAMLAILAAAIVPLVAGAEDRARAEEAVRELDRVKSAIDEFNAQVGVYPQLLAHTAEPIAAGDANSCGTGYNPGQRNRWGNNDASYGPWFRDHMIVEDFGFATSLGLVRDSTTRSGNDLIVSIVDVSEAQAVELDGIIDSLPGGAGPNLGEIRWGAIVNGVTTVQYTLNRPGC